VLAQLCHLHPGEGSDCPARGSEREPRCLRVAVPAQASEDPRTLGEHPRLGPGRVATARIRGAPGVADGIAAGPATEVGGAPRRPPRFIVGPGLTDGQARSLGGEQIVFADRVHGGGLRLRSKRRIEAAERRFVSTLLSKRTCQACEVAGWGLAPAGRVGIAAVDVNQEATQGSDVLVVVTDDVDQRPGLTEAQVVEIPRWNLPARHVRVAPKAEQLSLDGGESRIGHPVAEDPPDQWQQIQVAGVEWRIRARHPVSGDEEWPVEAAAVVRDQPAVARDVGRELREQRRLVGMIREQELDLPESAALPPAQPDEEGERSRSGRETGRLGVEAEQRSIGRRLPGEVGQASAINREQRARRLDPDERAA